MAKVEQDREDILREATALSPRAELRSPEFPENIVFGFRSTGGLSLFFGADPVYQFNSEGELRRAYVGGALFKSVKGRLQRLDRKRTANEVNLIQSELNKAEEAAFLEFLESHCRRLVTSLDAGRYELLAEVPIASNAIERLRAALANLSSPPKVAARPNAT